MADRTPPHPSFGAAVGRATMSIGLLLLAFAAYQLWGTGLSEARAQEVLAEELAAVIDERTIHDRPLPDWPDHEPGIEVVEPADAAIVGAVEAVSDRGQAQSTVIDVAAPLPALEAGQPFARLVIPTIDVDKTVVEGTTREALRTGPGHYRGTARPGRYGNVAIAGHRTTYGAPFRDIDQLAPGDPIVVETADGTFTYRVEAQIADDGTDRGHRIVTPEEVEVIADKGDPRLTLTACHPLYSARERIVVTAVLERSTDAVEPIVADEPFHLASQTPTPPPSPPQAEQVAAPMATKPPGAATSPHPIDGVPTGLRVELPAEMTAAIDDDLGWQPAHAAATARWAALTALVISGAWVLGRLWRRVPAYLMAGPSFALCLITCFGHLDQLIPAA